MAGIFPQPATVTPGVFPMAAPEQPSIFPTAPIVPPNPFLPQVGVSTSYGLGVPGQTIEETAMTYGSTTLGMQMAQQQAAMMQAAGLPPDVDPRALMTSDVKSEETQAALAKIATANPDLAASLAARYQGPEAEAEESGGLWDSLKGLVGDVFEPVLSLGAKALDILTRPARIIPELLVDPEGDPWYEDIGQALSGNSTATGADVVEHWGIENGLAKGILGFAFDVAADPLTYATFGLAGVGRQLASRTAATAVGTKVFTEQAAAAGLAFGSRTFDDVGRQVMGRFMEAGGVHADAALALTADGLSGIPKEILDITYSAADEIAKGVSRTGLKKMPARIRVGGKWVDSKEYLTMLDDMRATGNWVRGSEWANTKALAGAAGGLRFRVAVPFTRFRYISPDLTKWSKFNSVFSPASNFFRGMTGFNRLQKAVQGLDPTEAKVAIDAFMNNGWQGLESAAPGLALKLGRFGGNAAYSVASRVGRITAGVSPHSVAIRQGGLAAFQAIGANRLASSTYNGLLDEAFVVRGDDGASIMLSAEKFKERLKYGLKHDPESQRRYIEWLDEVPSSQHVTDPETYRAAKLAEKGEDAADSIDQSLARWKELDARLTPEERETLELVRRGFEQIRVNANKLGVNALDRTTYYDSVLGLNTGDINKWQESAIAEVRGVDFYVADSPAADAVRAHGEGYGFGHRIYSSEASNPNNGVTEMKVEDLWNLRERIEYRTPQGMERDYAGEAWGDTFDSLKADIKTNGVHEPVIIDYDDVAKEANLNNGHHRVMALRELRDEFAAANPNVPNPYDKVKVTVKRQEGLRRTVGAEGYDVYDVKDTHAAALDELLSQKDTPSGIAVRADIRKPLVVDLNEGAIAHEGDLLKERYSGTLAELDAKRGAHQLHTPELENDIIWNRWKAEKADQLITQSLIDEGYDSILYRNADGTMEGTVLYNAAEPAKIKQHVPEAGQVMGDRAYFPRVMSDDYHAAKFGESKAKKFHGSGTLAHEEHRNLSGTFYDDDALIHTFDDIDLPEGKSAFVTDVGEAYARYAERMARAAAQEQLVVTGRRMARLGLDENIGESMLVNRYVARASAQNDATIWKLGAKVVAAQDKHSAQSRKALELEEAIGQRTAKAHMSFEQSMQGEGKTWLAAGERRLEREVAKQGGYDATARLALIKRRAKLMRNIKNATKPGYRGMSTDRAAKEIAQLDRRLQYLTTIKKAPADTEKVAAARAIFSERAAKEAAKLEVRAAKDALALRRAKQKIENAYNEVHKMRARMETDMAPMLPGIRPATKDLRGYETLRDIKGLEGVAMHPYMAAEFRSALAGYDPGVMRKAWRQWMMGPWKKWATVYFPGFHVRNNMGAWFNNKIGGVTNSHYEASYRISRALTGKSKYSNGGAKALIREADRKAWGLTRAEFEHIKTYEDLGHMIHMNGVRSTNSQAFADIRPEFDDLVRSVQGKRTAPSKLTYPARKYGKGARVATEVTENFHRQAAFLRGLEVTTGDVQGARAFTMMRHGDYEDLTDFEQFIKDLVPFYKWTRTNLPFQIHNLLENPAFQLSVIKAKDAGYVAMGHDPDEVQHKQLDFVKDAFTIPFPKGSSSDDKIEMIALDLPMADLFHGANDYIGMFLPTILPMIENAVGKDFWSGKPLEGKRVNLGGWASLPGVRTLMEPFVTRDKDGNATIDDRTQNLLGAIPVFSRFQNWIFSEPNNVRGRMRSVASSLFGLQLREQGEAELLSWEMDFYFNEVDPYIRLLRELGVRLPEPGDVSPEVYSYLGFQPPAPEPTTTTPAVPAVA